MDQRHRRLRRLAATTRVLSYGRVRVGLLDPAVNPPLSASISSLGGAGSHQVLRRSLVRARLVTV